MEEEKIEVNNESKKFDFKNFDFKNFDYKKYLPYAGIALAVIIVILIITSLIGGPKKAVKKYISGMSSGNAKKVVNSMDIIGSMAWGYYYDEDDFEEEDYEEFIEEYEEYEDEYADELKDEMDEMLDEMDETFDDIDDEYKSYKMKIEKFKDVEELGKDLYAVDVKVSLEAKPKDKKETDEIDESATVTFIVYKNKVISAGGLGI